MSAFELPRSRVDVERLLSERQWVQRLAQSLVADPNQADDVAQESWLAALRHPPRHDANLRSWLSRLVRNTAAAMRRGDARRSERERSSTQPTVTAGSSEALERAEIVRELVEAVLALEPARREALVLVYFEGLAPNVAADQLGIPHSTFRTHVRRGLAEVREKLERKRGREGWLPALTVLAGRPETHAVGVTLMGTKLVTAGAAVVVIALGLWSWSRSRALQDIASAATTTNTRLSAVETTEGLAPPLATPGGRESRALVSAQKTAKTSTLIVSAKWASSSQPARDVQIMVAWKDESGSYRQRQMRSDEAGRAVFEGLECASVGVSTDRGFEDGTALAPGETTLFEVRIPTDIHVRGRVVGAGDEPVFGASIYIGTRFGNVGFDEPVCTTDGDGRFDLGAISRQRQIYARRDDMGASFGGMPLDSAPETIDILLRMQGVGCELNGSVVDETGTPVGGAEVFATARGNPPGSTNADVRWMRAPGTRVVTDAEGRFRIRGLVEITHALRIRANGFAAHEEVVNLVRDVPTTVRVTLIPGLVVHGVVRDGSGAGVPGAVVVLIEPQAQLTTDSAGAFRFNDAKPGPRRYQVRSKSAGMALGTIDIPHMPSFEWDPVVDRGRVIEGRVVDDAGQPLAQWWVRSEVTTNEIDPKEFELSLLTDATVLRTDVDGRFVLTNCSKFARRLSVSSPEIGVNGLAAVTVEDVAAGTKDLVIRVTRESARTQTIRGRIMDQHGSPLAGARIRLSRKIVMAAVQAVDVKSAYGTGAFTIQGVEPAEYELTVRAEGLCEHVESVTVRDASVELEPIRLTQGGSLVVRLSLEDAALLRAGYANLFARGARELPLVLFGEEARLDNLEPGDWTIASSDYTRSSSDGSKVRVSGPLRPFLVKAGETTYVDYELVKLKYPK